VCSSAHIEVVTRFFLDILWHIIYSTNISCSFLHSVQSFWQRCNKNFILDIIPREKISGELVWVTLSPLSQSNNPATTFSGKLWPHWKWGGTHLVGTQHLICVLAVGESGEIPIGHDKQSLLLCWTIYSMELNTAPKGNDKFLFICGLIFNLSLLVHSQ
jgi:hypothetical protein